MLLPNVIESVGSCLWLWRSMRWAQGRLCWPYAGTGPGRWPCSSPAPDPYRPETIQNYWCRNFKHFCGSLLGIFFYYWHRENVNLKTSGARHKRPASGRFVRDLGVIRSQNIFQPVLITIRLHRKYNIMAKSQAKLFIKSHENKGVHKFCYKTFLESYISPLLYLWDPSSNALLIPCGCHFFKCCF